MEIYEAIVLGAVQGLSEFLPISSSGHLSLLARLFGICENTLFYSVMLHLGTLIPVIIILRKKILGLIKSPNLIFNLILATIPAGIIGIVFSKVFFIDKVFENAPILLSITFLITAFEMFLCQKISKEKRLNNPINKKTAFIMGCGQAVGVLTGISRSGSTILFGNIAKVNRQDNADFAFLMSIPIILSAVLLESVDILTCGAPILVDFLPLLFGILSASVFGYVSISFMFSVIKKANYMWFGFYMIFISIVNLLTCLI
jgi:undecaprenyl-diphosphatase